MHGIDETGGPADLDRSGWPEGPPPRGPLGPEFVRRWKEAVCRRLKAEGLTVRQRAELTGLSRRQVERVDRPRTPKSAPRLADETPPGPTLAPGTDADPRPARLTRSEHAELLADYGSDPELAAWIASQKPSPPAAAPPADSHPAA